MRSGTASDILANFSGYRKKADQFKSDADSFFNRDEISVYKMSWSYFLAAATLDQMAGVLGDEDSRKAQMYNESGKPTTILITLFRKQKNIDTHGRHTICLEWPSKRPSSFD
jgi:hypothetical protein